MGCDLPFVFRIDAHSSYPAHVAGPDAEGTYVTTIGGVTYDFDLLEGVLSLPTVDPESGVTLEFGRFELRVHQRGGRVRFEAATVIDGVRFVAAADSNEERTLWDLAARLDPAAVPRCCFFCRWSDVEPGTGWGHLACFVEVGDTYHARVTTGEAHMRKWVTALPHRWVDEWHNCQRWQLRPLGYGYRGRIGNIDVPKDNDPSTGSDGPR